MDNNVTWDTNQIPTAEGFYVSPTIANFMQAQTGAAATSAIGAARSADVYSKSEADTLLEGKADLVGGAVPLAQVPSLPASQVNTGTFAVARIPNLSADKVTSGVLADARIPSTVARTDDVYAKTETYSQQEVDNLLDGKADEGDSYTKAEADGLLEDKADIVDGTVPLAQVPNLPASKTTSGTFADARIPSTIARAANVYTKTEADGLLSQKADTSSVYTKSESDSLLNDKADASEVYTKTEVDDLLDDLPSVDAYSKSQTDTLLEGKADLVSGTVPLAQVPDLPASKVTTGSFDVARIPNLNASKIDAGTFADARIPSLNASKINAGTFADARIPATIARMTDLDAKADKVDTYTKTETDNLLSAKADTGDSYTKAESDSLLSAKADAATTYTKSEINSQLLFKADLVGGRLAAAQVPNNVLLTSSSLDASKLTGVVDSAVLPSDILYESSSIPAANVSGVLVAGNIPNLNASKVNAGVFADARIPATIARTANITALSQRVDLSKRPFGGVRTEGSAAQTARFWVPGYTVYLAGGDTEIGFFIEDEQPGGGRYIGCGFDGGWMLSTHPSNRNLYLTIYRSSASAAYASAVWPRPGGSVFTDRTHIAVTIRNVTTAPEVELFINGASLGVQTPATTGAYGESVRDLTVGSDMPTGVNVNNGTYSGVQVFNRHLTPEERMTIVSSGGHVVPVSARSACELNLRCDDGNGDQLRDMSGNGRHGLLGLSGCDHLIIKDRGKITQGATNYSDGTYLLGDRPILPDNAYVTGLIVNGEVMPLNAYYQTPALRQIRIINGGNGDAWLQRSNGTTHETLVETPHSLTGLSIALTWEVI